MDLYSRGAVIRLGFDAHMPRGGGSFVNRLSDSNGVKGNPTLPRQPFCQHSKLPADHDILLLSYQSKMFSTAPAILLFHAFVLLKASLCNSQNVSFETLLPGFESILGPDPRITLLAQSEEAIFHEGGVYYPQTKSLFVTSDNLETNSTASGLVSFISVVSGGNLSSESEIEVQRLDNGAHGIPFPLGGYRYISSSNAIVWAAQGSLEKAGGLYFLNPVPPYNATQVLSAYGVYEFNSPNDVAVVPSGEIYFTDPVYGFEYGFREEVFLPNQVYRFNPSTGTVRAVADGFGRSNGIGVSKGGDTVYVIDTGAQVGNGTIDLQSPRTIYAFDVQRSGDTGGFLGNKHLFAFPDVGGYKGVKTDTEGNVYAGYDRGVAVFNVEGDLLGVVEIEDGIANIGFGEPGVLFALGDTRLWRIDLSESVVGSSYLI